MYGLTNSEMCCVLKRLTESQADEVDDNACAKWENEKVEDAIQKLSRVYNEMCLKEK